MVRTHMLSVAAFLRRFVVLESLNGPDAYALLNSEVGIPRSLTHPSGVVVGRYGDRQTVYWDCFDYVSEMGQRLVTLEEKRLANHLHWTRNVSSVSVTVLRRVVESPWFWFRSAS